MIIPYVLTKRGQIYLAFSLLVVFAGTIQAVFSGHYFMVLLGFASLIFFPYFYFRRLAGRSIKIFEDRLNLPPSGGARHTVDVFFKDVVKFTRDTPFILDLLGVNGQIMTRTEHYILPFMFVSPKTLDDLEEILRVNSPEAFRE